MRRHRYILPLLVTLILISCEEAIDREILVQEESVLVVEGMITNELKQHEVRISGIIPNLNQTPSPVSGAFVAITDQVDVFQLTEQSDNPGVYITEDSVRGFFDKTYVLFISYQGKEYLAADRMQPVEPLEELQLSRNDDGLYSIVFQDTQDPSMTTYDIDWTGSSFCLDADLCKAKTIYYTLDNADINEVFKPEKETLLFPEGSTVIRSRFSLSFLHQEFLRALLIETEWRGSIFDVQKSNVRGNLSGGAIGFFAASTVVRDTTLVE